MKSPEISIINVHLGASPEIALRATHSFRSKGSMEMDSTGDWWGQMGTDGVTYLHQTTPCKSFAVSSENCSVQEESIQNLDQKAKGGVQPCPCPLWVLAIAGQGYLTYTMREVTVPDSQGCWRELRDIHLQNALQVTKAKEVTSLAI